MGSAGAAKWAGSATRRYANAITRHTSSNENVCYFVVIELIVHLLSDVKSQLGPSQSKRG
jgi:hypothetical protein